MIFFLFLPQNIDCDEAVLTSTHNLCFGAKIRKIGIPLHTQFFYIKVGFKGVLIARRCFLDGMIKGNCITATVMPNHYMNTLKQPLLVLQIQKT